MRKITGIFYLILINVLPLVYFLLIQDKAIVDDDILIKIDKQFSFVSWSVTAITSILAFGVLYLTILLDKNLFNNIKRTKEFYKPYHIEKKDIKNYIYGNRNLEWKSGLLIFFIIFSVSTFFINLFWINCISYYSNYGIFDFKSIFSFLWVVDINIMSDILAVCVPFTFWIITVAINIFVYLILAENRLLIKIKIPTQKESLDIKFLKSQNADLNELLYKAGPLLTIYDKYANQRKTLDLYLEQDIPWTNYFLVFKFYKDELVKYKLYYKNCAEELNQIRPKSTVIEIDNDNFYEFLEKDANFVDVSVFSLEYDEVASFKLSLIKNRDQSIFIPFRQILHNGKHIEKGRLEIMKNKFDLEKVDME